MGTRSDIIVHRAEPFGPLYPNLPSVTKWRKSARAAGGAMQMDRALRQGYGAAVHEAIRTLQAQELRRELVAPSANCASGTFHSDGRKIHQAVRGQQAGELARCASAIRKRREPEEWRAMYAEAMKEKRERECR